MKNQNGYVDSFAKLIQCPTVTNSGHEYFDAFHKVLDEEFPHVTATCKKIEVGGDVLLYKWSGKSSSRPLVLMAHQDVVPAVGGDWKYPPFSAKCMAEAQWTAKTPSFPPYKPSKNSLNKVLCPNKTFI